MPEYLYGLWPAIECLQAERRQVESVIISDNLDSKGRIGDLIGIAQNRGINVQRANKRILDDLANGANHQGVVLRTGKYPYTDFEDLLEVPAQRAKSPSFSCSICSKTHKTGRTLARGGCCGYSWCHLARTTRCWCDGIPSLPPVQAQSSICTSHK
jgi:hypothetical protein